MMREDEDTTASDEPGRCGWLVTAAGAVGDLGSPFYDEERQRDVWNEASAVGFQTTLWLGFAAAAGMVWLGGSSALPYVLVMLGVLSVASLASLVYAQRLGVDVDQASRMWRARMVPFLLLVVFLVVGLFRAAAPDGFSAGLAWGGAAGAGVALLSVVWARVRDHRRASRATEET